MRKTLIVLHRWIALVVGAILFLTAMSGATLVFEGAIDRALNPTLWKAEPQGTLLPIDTLVARVEAQFAASPVSSVGMSSASTRRLLLESWKPLTTSQFPLPLVHYLTWSEIRFEIVPSSSDARILLALMSSPE